MRMKKRWAGRLAAGLFLLCAAGLLWLLGAETAPRREPVYLTPEAVSGAPGLDGLYLYTGKLELTYTLPAPPGNLRPILEIRTLSAAAELLLDGEPFQRVSEGLGWAYLTLPPDCAGKTLTLRMEKGENDTIPILYLTDNLMIYEQVRADTSLMAFPAAAFGMIWLLTLGVFLFGALEGTRHWPALLLSAAAAVWCAVSLVRTGALPPTLEMFLQDPLFC